MQHLVQGPRLLTHDLDAVFRASIPGDQHGAEDGLMVGGVQGPEVELGTTHAEERFQPKAGIVVVERVALRILKPDPGRILAQDRELGPMDRVLKQPAHRTDQERIVHGLQLVAAVVGAGLQPRGDPVETDRLGGSHGIAELEAPAMEHGRLFPSRQVARHLKGLDTVGRIRGAESQPTQRVGPQHLEWPGQNPARHHTGNPKGGQPTGNHRVPRNASVRISTAWKRRQHHHHSLD